MVSLRSSGGVLRKPPDHSRLQTRRAVILAPALSQQPGVPAGVVSSTQAEQGSQFCSPRLSVNFASLLPLLLQIGQTPRLWSVSGLQEACFTKPPDHSRLQSRRAGHTGPSPQPAARGTIGSSPQHSASAKPLILLALAQRQCSHSRRSQNTQPPALQQGFQSSKFKKFVLCYIYFWRFWHYTYSW